MANVITIDIGASKIRFMTVSEKKEMTEYLDTPPVNLIGRKLNNEELSQLLTDNISRSIDDMKKEGNVVSAVSIGSPGPLDPIKGVIQNPPNLRGLKDLAIVDELKKIFNMPVFLLNDADAALLGEWWLLDHKRYKNIIYLTLSTGVGSGEVKNSQLKTGSELGHKPLAIEGEERTCSCREQNHVEAYLGTKGLAEIYSKIFKLKSSNLEPERQHLTSRKMRKGVASLDPKWLAVQETYAKYLAIFLKDVATKFRPELIILGGGIIFGNESLLAKTKEELAKIAPQEITKIELAQSGNNVNLGAAKYALEQLEG